MNWQTVYDISGDGARDFSGYLIAGAGVLALAAVFALRARRRGERSGTARVLALFALVIAGLGYGVNSWDQNRLTAALETGAVQQVAGAIRHHATVSAQIQVEQRRRHLVQFADAAGGGACSADPPDRRAGQAEPGNQQQTQQLDEMRQCPGGRSGRHPQTQQTGHQEPELCQ